MKRTLVPHAIVLGAALAGIGTGVASAGQLGGVLGKAVKVGGVTFLVRQYGSGINNAINTLLAQRGVRYEGKTKVVPAFAAGSGAYIGAYQVQGPPRAVDKVRYVGAVEIPLGRLRGRALFPVQSLTKGTSKLKPVPGVGVTAVVDFRI